jgi:hypothetical protein
MALLPPARYFLLAHSPLGQVGLGGSEVTFGGAEVTFGEAEAALGGDDVDGGEMGADPVLLTGITGDVCFTGPPTTLDLLFEPPTAFCAKAGLANAQSTTTDRTAALFIDDFPFKSSGIRR